ncbi:Hypothetical predicted protein, partial [Paramuricea clavata]
IWRRVVTLSLSVVPICKKDVKSHLKYFNCYDSALKMEADLLLARAECRLKRFLSQLLGYTGGSKFTYIASSKFQNAVLFVNMAKISSKDVHIKLRESRERSVPCDRNLCILSTFFGIFEMVTYYQKDMYISFSLGSPPCQENESRPWNNSSPISTTLQPHLKSCPSDLLKTTTAPMYAKQWNALPLYLILVHTIQKERTVVSRQLKAREQRKLKLPSLEAKQISYCEW